MKAEKSFRSKPCQFSRRIRCAELDEICLLMREKTYKRLTVAFFVGVRACSLELYSVHEKPVKPLRGNPAGRPAMRPDSATMFAGHPRTHTHTRLRRGSAVAPAAGQKKKRCKEKAWMPAARAVPSPLTAGCAYSLAASRPRKRPHRLRYRRARALQYEKGKTKIKMK